MHLKTNICKRENIEYYTLKSLKCRGNSQIFERETVFFARVENPKFDHEKKYRPEKSKKSCKL